MSAVTLQILEPQHDTAFAGELLVTFRGAITQLPEDLEGISLYYRWYSSLYAGDKDDYSMNKDALPSPDAPFPTTLGVGTHVITFAASDRAGQTAADLEATQHGGVTGGSEGDARCLLHVFKANIVSPSSGATLHRTGSILEAEAPQQWGQPAPDPLHPYEPNEEYHKHNRLQYRWEFIPAGPPAGRATVNLIPALDQWVFDPETSPIVIRYQGPLPGSLAGDYLLALHVEDNTEAYIGSHRDTVDVRVTA